MSPTLLWPIKRLRAPDFAINASPRNLRGPANALGQSQIASSDAGIWTATLGQVVIKSRDEVLAWRALQAHMEGGLTPILIPLRRAYQPVPEVVRQLRLYDPVPHSDDSGFDDGTAYLNRVIDVTMGAAAPRRATQIAVDIHLAAPLEPGQHFSIGERLYRIRRVVEQSASSAVLKLNLPLREAVEAGQPLEFDNPVCRMRLASDNEMTLNLRLRRFAAPTVSFVEDL